MPQHTDFANKPLRKLNRLALLFAISLPLLGCELYFGDDEPGPVDEPTTAREFFDSNVAPILDSQCSACHAGERVGLDFMAPETYDSVMAWPALLDRNTYTNSRLLTKGLHEGPGLDEAERETILEWLRLESEGL